MSIANSMCTLFYISMALPRLQNIKGHIAFKWCMWLMTISMCGFIQMSAFDLILVVYDDIGESQIFKGVGIPSMQRDILEYYRSIRVTPIMDGHLRDKFVSLLST